MKTMMCPMNSDWQSDSFRWSALFYIPFLWLGSGAATGALFAWASGISGSGFLITTFLGAYAGVAGTVAHCIMILLRRFRRASVPMQTLSLWTCALAVFQSFLFADSVCCGSTFSWGDGLLRFGVPALVAAAVFNLVLRRVSKA